MAQNFPADVVFPHIFLVNADSFCTRVHLNDTWRETILELCGEFWRDGFEGVENDEREDAVRCGSYPDIISIRAMKVAMKTPSTHQQD